MGVSKARVKGPTATTRSKGGSSSSKGPTTTTAIVLPTTQLEAEHLEEIKGGSLRKSKAALTESQHVDKAMKANFKGFQPFNLYKKVIDGKTCLERVADARASKLTMGGTFYTQLRDMYADDALPFKAIRIDNEAEQLMPALTNALLPVYSSRSYDALQEFLQEGDIVPNQRCYAMLLKVLAKVPPIHPRKNLDIHLDCMAYVSRHGLHTKYLPASECMKPIWDRVLQRMAAKYHNTALSVPLFWEGYSHIGVLLIPKADMDICCQLKAGESWASIETSLFKVVQSCETGRTLFLNQVTRLHRSKATGAIALAIDQLASKNVTVGTLSACRTEFVDALRSMGIDPSKIVTAYKHKTSRYREMELEFTVNSAMDEFRTELACFTQSLGVDSKVLSPVGPEDELIGLRAAPTLTIEAACVDESQRARNTANNLLQGVEHSSGPAILQVFMEHSSILRGLDNMWKIMPTLFQSCIGDEGDTRLKSMVRAALPTAAIPITVAESLQKLEAISKGKLLQFCGAGSAAICSKIFAWVAAIAGERVPDITGDTSVFGNDIRSLVANFLKFEYPDGHDKHGSVAFGGVAAKLYYDDVVAKIAVNSPDMCMKLLSPLQIYGWLLTPTQVQHVKALVDAEYKKGSLPCVAVSDETVAKPSRKRLAPDFAAELAKLSKN
ncbi:unnamed protein product [Polarella glacialis]|uniref:Uncharacterized protein n=1 Tax=Polarella glacialis TaxID=89957 RepID=A0A813FVD5_POLGL|nr:unnamed protein product [Polarella glacialis]